MTTMVSPLPLPLCGWFRTCLYDLLSFVLRNGQR